MSDSILATPHGAVLELRLNRAQKRNAFSAEMYWRLAELLNAAAGDAGVRCVLLTGAPAAFCAGNDLDDFIAAGDCRDPDELPFMAFMRALAPFPKPVIAAVRGHAVGIGTTLLLHCDLVYAAPSARLQLPFVALGVCPEFGSSYLLPRLLGPARAAELILLGEAIDAARAQALGLVNAVIADDAVEAEALRVAQRLAQQPPQAVRTSKRLLKGWRLDEVIAVCRAEGEQLLPLFRGPEVREAIGAFREKRRPDFSSFA